jgi:hypothetical protein
VETKWRYKKRTNIFNKKLILISKTQSLTEDGVGRRNTSGCRTVLAVAMRSKVVSD